MKLIHKKLILGKKPTQQEVKEFSQKKSDIRMRLLEGKQYIAYALLMDLLSHQQNFETSRDYLMKRIGCTSVGTYNDALKALRQYGHLRIEGDNRNSTYYIYEYPEPGLFEVKAVKKTRKNNIKKEEESLDESTDVKVQEKKQEINSEIEKKELILNVEIPQQPENSLFTPEEWLAIHTKNKSDEKNSKTKEARRERESSGINFSEGNRASS